MAINQNPFTGAPLYLKDSSWAGKYFGGQTMLNTPKRKFTFLCGFLPNFNAFRNVEGGNELARALQSPEYVFLAKGFEPPGYSIETQKLDQYNKKRVVQTRINYDPVSIRFHDDTDNKLIKLVDTYVKYYYSDSYNNEHTHWSLDTIRDFINEGNWGAKINQDKYLFNGVWVVWSNGGAMTTALMFNPIISEIKLDTLDYADNAPLEISMTIEYEGVVFKNINESLTSGSHNAQNIFQLLKETENIGQFFEGPQAPTRQSPASRTPGLGEIFQTGATFFGKYNGKPTIKDALGDFVLRPIQGQLSGALGSWGNFNFGGTGQSKAQGGMFGEVGNAVGSTVQGLETETANVFRPTQFSTTGDARANNEFLNSTGVADKFSGDN